MAPCSRPWVLPAPSLSVNSGGAMKEDGGNSFLFASVAPRWRVLAWQAGSHVSASSVQDPAYGSRRCVDRARAMKARAVEPRDCTRPMPLRLRLSAMGKQVVRRSLLS